jgi:hypothetical protein
MRLSLRLQGLGEQEDLLEVAGARKEQHVGAAGLSASAAQPPISVMSSPRQPPATRFRLSWNQYSTPRNDVS